MAEYHFTTVWTFSEPLEKVWQVIYAMDQWPQWWPYVRSVEKLREGHAGEIGSIRRIRWATALPYSITFDSELTFLDPMRKMEGRAFGDLDGSGIWIFRASGNTTVVQYDWHVRTTKKWMNLIEPVARPFFTWNHNRVMHAGFTGLQKRLDHMVS